MKMLLVVCMMLAATSARAELCITDRNGEIISCGDYENVQQCERAARRLGGMCILR